MMDEEKKKKFKNVMMTYGIPLLGLMVVIIWYYATFGGPLDECVVTKVWFEEAFGWPIEDIGQNYEVKDGKICITNPELLKEIYDLVG